MRLREQADAREVAGVEQFTLDRAAFGLAEDPADGGPDAPRANVPTD
jgi:hypothetical protein